MIYIYIVIAFLWLSITLYLLLGGADFGVGIVELFAGKKFRNDTKDIMAHQIAPIWEANHMWLIIAVVVLFVGFPTIYSQLSIYLHIPLVVMLIGIIARGTSYTFRHYDAINDHWHNLYAKIFEYSSLLTPLFLGIIAASVVSGSIDNEATNFLDAYIFSWLSWFNVSVGIFTISICGFLASIFVIRFSPNKTVDKILKRNGIKFTLITLITGSIVFIVSIWKKVPLLEWIFSNFIGYFTVSLATIAVGLLLYSLKNGHLKYIRLYAGFIVLMIMVSISYSHYPNLVVFKNGSYFSLIEEGKKGATEMLAWSLMIGCIFILPFLFYLFYSFEKKPRSR